MIATSLRMPKSYYALSDGHQNGRGTKTPLAAALELMGDG